MAAIPNYGDAAICFFGADHAIGPCRIASRQHAIIDSKMACRDVASNGLVYGRGFKLHPIAPNGKS